MTIVQRRQRTRSAAHRPAAVPGNPDARTPADAVLDVAGLTADYGTHRVVDGLDLRIHTGEIVTLLGPSGCGKTTTLRCVAGLHRVSLGTITLAGQVVGAPKVHVGPERRPVNMVFQSYALWPHMTVFDNIAYGLRAQRLPRDEITRRTEEMLGLVGLGGYGPRSATNLSGGQQQRVVLARGLVTRPELLLLDEPLSNLDTELRLRMRTEIHALQRSLGLSMLYVTHDRAEALALSDRVVVMRDGIAQQAGRPAELYSAPVNRFVAEALGPVNVLPATVRTGGAATRAVLTGVPTGPALPAADRCGDRAASAGDEIDLLVRPEALTLSAEDGTGDGLPSEVELIEFLGNRTEVVCRSGPHRFVVDLPRPPVGVAAGDTVTVRLDEHAAPPAWQPRTPARKDG